LPWDGNPEGTLGRLEIVRRAASVDTVVGSIQDRFHSDATTIDHARPVVYGSPNEHNTGHLAFDPVRGWLLIPIRTYCDGSSCSYGNSGYSILAITGLTPLFDILQTYTPTADVPASPRTPKACAPSTTSTPTGGTYPTFRTSLKRSRCSATTRRRHRRPGNI